MMGINPNNEQKKKVYEEALERVTEEIDFLKECESFLNKKMTCYSRDKSNLCGSDGLEEKSITVIWRSISDIIRRIEILREGIESSNIKTSYKYLNLIHVGPNFYHKFTNRLRELNVKLSQEDHLAHSEKDKLNNRLKSVFNNLDVFKQVIDQTIPIIINLETFSHVKTISENIVRIGANGSGKSTFSRTIRAYKDGNVAIIPAQKVLFFNPTPNINIDDNTINRVENYQAHDKVGNESNFASQLVQDLPQLIQALYTEHYQVLNRNDHAQGNNSPIKNEESVIKEVINIWNDIFSHRKLSLPKDVKFDINVSASNGKSYSFAALSDGEKAAFYYIAHVLLAKKESYVVVDEPENHLNLAIVNKLWNVLEGKRNDCQFIYLTHNPNFVFSRVKCRKLWCKAYKHPKQWEMENLPSTKEIPEKLLVELLGCRKKILFCEGEDKENSIDHKLYPVLFTEYNVIPVKGHRQVINYTRAYNKNKKIFQNIAVGVIDGDYYLEEEKAA